MTRRWAWANLVFALTVAAVAMGSSMPAHATVAQDVRQDARWIVLSALPSGAIATNPRHKSIRPYEGNYAAWGLAEDAAMTGNDATAGSAWRWLYWYMRHQDSQGFVYQYDRNSDGSWSCRIDSGTGACDTDSTDATSGLYMEAALAAWRVDPTRFLRRLRKIHPALIRAVDAIEATMDADGLTWAKPSWHVKYLMDNAETYGGLVAGARIGKILGDPALHNRALADARAERHGMNTVMWNSSNHTYDWAFHGAQGNFQKVPCDWSVLYPDSVEQAWAVAYGVPNATVASQLMSTFAQNQPNWDHPNAQATYYDAAACPGTTCQQPVGYWPPVGWAFHRVGDSVEASAGARSIHAGAVADHRAKPFSVGWDGMLLRLEIFAMTHR